MDQDARQPAGGAMKASAAAPQFTVIGPDDPRLAAHIPPALRELRPSSDHPATHRRSPFR